jgi:hypothetical protein
VARTLWVVCLLDPGRRHWQLQTIRKQITCCWCVLLQVVLSWCSASSRHTFLVSMLAATSAGVMLCGADDGYAGQQALLCLQ